MTRKEAIDLARRAFASDEVAEYLSGGKDYAIPMNQFVPANVPTNFEYIIDIGIFGYYAEEHDPHIPEKYLAAINHLLEGDCVSVWCAYMVCVFQISFERRQEAPFAIISDDVVSKVSAALYHNKAELESCHLWQGSDRERGLWQDIEATDHTTLKIYEVSFL